MMVYKIEFYATCLEYNFFSFRITVRSGAESGFFLQLNRIPIRGKQIVSSSLYISSWMTSYIIMIWISSTLKFLYFLGGKETFPCYYCDKKFNLKIKLTMHMKKCSSKRSLWIDLQQARGMYYLLFVLFTSRQGWHLKTQLKKP